MEIIFVLLDYILKPFIKIGCLKVIDSRGKTYTYHGKEGIKSSFRLHNTKIERQMFWQPEMALGEGYMNGTVTLEEGSLYDLLDLATKNLFINSNRIGLFPKMFYTVTKMLSRIQEYNSSHLAYQRISQHYDLNEDFIRLFLDKDLQYSCAYFKNLQDDLDVAQENKKKHIARKLLLKPGQRLLDIGSGWGGMALYLAKQADIEVVGITLSKEQHKLATERASQLNLSDRVKFYLRDYREEKGQYDRIVSVGMFEHVGVPHYSEYINQIHKLLKKDGIMLLHSIGSAGTPRPTNAWIRKYIFQGGCCPSLSQVLPSIENSDLFITDIELLHLHYAETLKKWRLNFMSNRETVKGLYDERFCRMWEYYLTSCEVAFRNQDLMVFQMQIVHDKTIIPSTREYQYQSENIAGLQKKETGLVSSL